MVSGDVQAQRAGADGQTRPVSSSALPAQPCRHASAAAMNASPPPVALAIWTWGRPRARILRRCRSAAYRRRRCQGRCRPAAGPVSSSFSAARAASAVVMDGHAAEQLRLDAVGLQGCRAGPARAASFGAFDGGDRVGQQGRVAVLGTASAATSAGRFVSTTTRSAWLMKSSRWRRKSGVMWS